ncbi:hypothetical protein LOD99_13724 [Oopsacas minuta]|uniref:Uncharacterized protein n=1 Tax=Oopsacas minuta TaxID=111878 RepID=A0AAV7KMQ0_9METZ|nr:hypothetical protein LOD99_13724 [Oopsacas minuta]
MSYTHEEANSFSQFKQLAEDLRMKMEEIHTITPSARKRFIEENTESGNIQILLSEILSCHNKCVAQRDQIEDEFQNEQEMSDSANDKLLESELHLQILKDEVNDLKRFRALGDGGSNPNEVIRTKLQERAKLTTRMEQLKLEEMNAAHSLLGRKAEYDKLNSKLSHLQEFFPLFSQSQPIYSETVAAMGQGMIPQEVYKLPLPLFMIYMRLTIYVINRMDPELECVVQESENNSTDSNTAVPHAYSIVLRYNQKQIAFYYHPGLQVISVRHNLPTQYGILIGLYPNDNGNVSPNPSTYYLLKTAIPTLSMDELVSGGHTGRMYRWSQVLAGLFFYPENQNELTIQVTSFDVIHQLDIVLSEAV